MNEYEEYEASIKWSYQAIRVAKKQARNMNNKIKNKSVGISQDAKKQAYI